MDKTSAQNKAIHAAAKSPHEKALRGKKLKGEGEYSKITFTPRNKSEERGFKKRFGGGNVNSEGGIPFGKAPKGER